MNWRAMWAWLKRFRDRPLALPAPDPIAYDVGSDLLVYAIGDIHGRRDLFDDLLGRITVDAASRGGAASMHLVLLGDLIDRGPESRGVVDRAIQLKEKLPGFTCLMGNHEEVLCAALAADWEALRLFPRIGGRETLLSYGVDEAIIDDEDPEALHRAMLAAIPEAHRDFFADMAHSRRIGGYLFAHAGIRPGVPIEEQLPDDLHWIRREFLLSKDDHGVMVVHGHTIEDEPVILSNRIGIDTGAFRTGHLTALGLQGTDWWLLST
jgi:serine/threonine protein phosphatase 1